MLKIINPLINEASLELVPKLALVVPLGILLFTGVSCSLSSSNNLEVVSYDMHCIRDDYWGVSDYIYQCNCYIDGVVKNTGNTNFDLVIVYVDWFDEDGLKVRTSHAYVDSLRAGQSAPFEVICRLDSYEKCYEKAEVWAEPFNQ